MLARLLRRLFSRPAVVSPSPDKAVTSCTEEESKAEEVYRSRREAILENLTEKENDIRRSAVKITADADQVAAMLRDAGDVRESLLKVLCAGPGSVPRGVLETLPEEAYRLCVLLKAADCYSTSVRNLEEIANGLRADAVSICG